MKVEGKNNRISALLDCYRRFLGWVRFTCVSTCVPDSWKKGPMYVFLIIFNVFYYFYTNMQKARQGRQEKRAKAVKKNAPNYVACLIRRWSSVGPPSASMTAWHRSGMDLKTRSTEESATRLSQSS